MKPAPQQPTDDPVGDAERIRRQLLRMVDTLDGLVTELREHMSDTHEGEPGA